MSGRLCQCLCLCMHVRTCAQAHASVFDVKPNLGVWGPVVRPSEVYSLPLDAEDAGGSGNWTLASASHASWLAVSPGTGAIFKIGVDDLLCPPPRGAGPSRKSRGRFGPSRGTARQRVWMWGSSAPDRPRIGPTPTPGRPQNKPAFPPLGVLGPQGPTGKALL